MIDINERKKIIGGSDISAIMGMNRWKTPLAVWAEKTGKLDNDPLKNFEAAEIGTELEEYVSRKFTRKTGVQLRRDNRTFRHEKYEYLVGHIDRWVIGEDALFEAKTCSAWKEKEWQGEEIPQEYILQVMWYMGLVEKSKAYIAVLIGGQKFVYKEVRFDKELFEKMVVAAVDFWENYVLTDCPPVAITGDSDTLSELYPLGGGGIHQADMDDAEILDNLIEERAGGIEQKKLVEAEIERIEAQIKQKIGEREGVSTGRYVVTWKNQKRVSADTEKLKSVGLFDEYSKVTEFRSLKATAVKVTNGVAK